VKLGVPAIGVLLLAIYVSAWPASVEGGRRVLKSTSGYQTVSMLDGGRTGLYYDVGERVGQLRPEARRVVLLGMGGGEMLRAVRRTLPSAELVGVELSPLTAAIARHEFGVEQLGVHVVVGDAFDYALAVQRGYFDAVLVDVFDDAVIPAKFRTADFFRGCRGALAPRGLLIMNVWPPELEPELVSRLVEAGFTAVRRELAAGGNVELIAER
jgi:spermidine synthase